MPNDLDKFKKRLEKIGNKLQEDSLKEIKSSIGKVMLEQANKLRNDVIQSIQNTERKGESVKRGRKQHFPSSPGNPPAIDTGNMLRGIVYEATDYGFIVGSIQTKLSYPAWLEQPPTKAHYEARPWLEPALNRRLPSIVDELSKVIPDFSDKVFRE